MADISSSEMGNFRLKRFGTTVSISADDVFAPGNDAGAATGAGASFGKTAASATEAARKASRLSAERATETFSKEKDWKKITIQVVNVYVCVCV
jgi:hypothetical protein